MLLHFSSTDLVDQVLDLAEFVAFLKTTKKTPELSIAVLELLLSAVACLVLFMIINMEDFYLDG